MNLLEQSEDPKRIFVEMSGFLEDGTFKFMKKLWTMLVSAQESVGGIPKVILDKAKEEMRKDRLAAENQVIPGDYREREISDRRPSRRRESRYFNFNSSRSPRYESPHRDASPRHHHSSRRSPLDLERRRHHDYRRSRSPSMSPPRSHRGRANRRKYSYSPPEARHERDNWRARESRDHSRSPEYTRNSGRERDYERQTSPQGTHSHDQRDDHHSYRNERDSRDRREHYSAYDRDREARVQRHHQQRDHS